MFIEILGAAIVLTIGKVVYSKVQRDNQLRLKAESEEARKKLLEGISAVVFVREPNGSRTNLEHHLEHELISRGARVHVANQQAGVALVKQGDFSPLHPEAHFSVIGTLIVRQDIVKHEKEWIETEHQFNVRKAKFQAEYQLWQSSGYYTGTPRPQLREREWTWVEVQTVHYQMSFRLISRDGTLLASGTCEDFPKMSVASYENTFRKLAKDAIAHLDETDVWSRIAIV